MALTDLERFIAGIDARTDLNEMLIRALIGTVAATRADPDKYLADFFEAISGFLDRIEDLGPAEGEYVREVRDARRRSSIVSPQKWRETQRRADRWPEKIRRKTEGNRIPNAALSHTLPVNFSPTNLHWF